MNVCQTMTMSGATVLVGGLAVLLAATALSPTVMAEEEPVGVRETRGVLEEPGEEPRRELRYDVEPGQTERVEIRLDLRAWDADAASKDAYPRARVTAELSVDEVDAGEIHVSGTYLSLDIEDPAVEGIPVEPVVVQQMLGPVIGASFRARLTDRGVVLESDFEPEEPLRPLAAYMIESVGLNRPLDYMVPVLPAEPVDTAAVWQVHKRSESLGVVGDLTIRSELTGVDDEVVTVHGTLRLTSEDEEMQYAGKPPDTRTHVLEGNTEGERDTQLRLDGLTPTEGRLAIRTETDFFIEQPSGGAEFQQIGESVMQFDAMD